MNQKHHVEREGQCDQPAIEQQKQSVHRRRLTADQQPAARPERRHDYQNTENECECAIRHILNDFKCLSLRQQLASLLRRQFPQHIRQDTAVPEVLGFLRSVHPDHGFEDFAVRSNLHARRTPERGSHALHLKNFFAR
jgi:hypothetical protein